MKHKQELLELYIQGKLVGLDLQSFEKLLETDVELQERLKLSLYLKKAFVHKREQEQANNKMISIDDILGRKKKENPNKKKILLWISSIAAVAALVLIYVAIQLQQPSITHLYSEFYETPDYEYIPSRGSGLLTEEQEQQTQKAISFYQNKGYADALLLFNTVEDEIGRENTPESSIFYSGICMLEVDKDKEALEKLNYLINHGKLFSEDAQWYLALLYLKDGELDKAKNILRDLSENGKLYKNKSAEILEKTN